eukprot:TRINITY_DN31761_c0_g1_i1.p1 TRINITY_DN31761_c0_g1~~TRINITY_DN31761_c0_g1_i1.p1  ORF type:complete len:297 (+),score=23.29 TRINITY_DN31761_c0_g1_i1:48-938(+)
MGSWLFRGRRCDHLRKVAYWAPAIGRHLCRRILVARVLAAFLAVSAVLAEQADGKPNPRPEKFHDTEPERNDALSPVQTALLILACLMFVCGSCVGWCLYLDNHPEFSRIRNIMHSLLVVATLFELALCGVGKFKWWMPGVLAVTNVWGLADAVMRYPVVHDIDSLFTFKQLLLLCGKIIACAFGFHDFNRSSHWFFALILVNVVCLPLLYFLALPLDDSEQENAAAAEDIVDTDLLLRLANVLLNGEERRRCIWACRRRVRAGTAQLALSSPTAAKLLCVVDPSYRRVLSRSRDV